MAKIKELLTEILGVQKQILGALQQPVKNHQPPAIQNQKAKPVVKKQKKKEKK